MKMNKILMIVGVLLFMSSCVIKKYHSPVVEVKVDSLYRVLESKVDTSSSTADLTWEQFFSDSLLRQCISRVLDNNHDMLIAKKRIDQAYAQLRSSRAAFWPTLSAGINGGMNIADNASPVYGYGVTGTASWEIDIWGKMLSAKRAQQAALMASEDSQQALQTALVAQTATAYYQLVAYDTERKIILETITNRTEYLDTIKIMKAAGKVNEVAVQQAVAQLGDVRAALPDMDLAIIQTENTLSMLMGTYSQAVTRTPNIDISDAKELTNIGVPSHLLSARPDVRAAEKNYRNAFEMYNVSRAAMYPSLTISANGSIADIFNSHFGTLNLLAGLTQPIFNGRKLRAQKEVAKLSADQAAITFQKTVLTAGMEVSNALASQQKSQYKSIEQVIQLEGYQKAYDYSFELFVNGYATYLDVLTAQTGVFNTQISIINTYLANLTARIELYRALGGGRTK